MNEVFPSTEDFLIKTSLYKSFTISEEIYKQIYQLEFFNGTIDTYCVGCKQSSIFEGVNIDERNVRLIPQCMLPFYSLPRKPDISSAMSDLEQKQKSVYDRIFSSTLECTRNRSHHISFFFLIKDRTITKFGQFPSIADINIGENSKYKKILGDKFQELNRAVGLYSHGVGIGAFVYLRRIFENLIEEAFQISKDVLNLKDEEFHTKRMDEKILLLKSYLPEILVKNKILHSILSKGIHSLSEDECLKYFESVRAGIELILDEKIEQELKSKKIETVLKDINKIKGNIS